MVTKVLVSQVGLGWPWLGIGQMLLILIQHITTPGYGHGYRFTRSQYLQILIRIYLLLHMEIHYRVFCAPFIE